MPASFAKSSFPFIAYTMVKVEQKELACHALQISTGELTQRAIFSGSMPEGHGKGLFLEEHIVFVIQYLKTGCPIKQIVTNSFAHIAF